MFTGKPKTTLSLLDPEYEDLSDIVGIVSPFETPLLDAIGNPRHIAESDPHRYEFRDTEGWSSAKNPVQTFSSQVEVGPSSGITFDINDELDYQKQERLREAIRELENCVINGRTEDGEGRLVGLCATIMTHEYPPCLDGDGELSHDDLVHAWRRINRQPGSRYAIIVSGAQNRKLNAIGTVPEGTSSVYVIDDERLPVIMSRWVAPDTVLIVDLAGVSVVPLRSQWFHYRPVSERAGAVHGEYTLEVRREDSHARIWGLAR